VASLKERGQWSGEIWNRRKNGEAFPEWLNISVLTDEQGRSPTMLPSLPIFPSARNTRPASSIWPNTMP
jgi:hypothetical protein